LAVCHWTDYLFGTTKSPQESLDKAIELAQRAIAQDNDLADGHRMLSSFYCWKREYEKALAEGEKALNLHPNGPEEIYNYAFILQSTGRAEEAIPLFQKAIRLNPNGPYYYFHQYGFALQAKRRSDEAILEFKKAIQRHPNDIWSHLGLAYTYGLTGREKEARAEAKEVLRIYPKFSLDYNQKISAYKDRSSSEKYYYNTLRKAGLK
jgi:adenylate cyclase